MYQKGDYVVYGCKGVCEVSEVTMLKMDRNAPEKPYYILEPCFQRESRIFTPVNSEKTVIRPILSRDAAEELIDDIPNIEEVWCANDKMREEQYRDIMKNCECRGWVRIIKSLYIRRQERLQNKKHLAVSDERYLKNAEDHLYAELSLALKIPREKVEEYIMSRVQMFVPAVEAN